MSTKDGPAQDVMAEWAKRYQDLGLPAGELASAAATAERLGAIAGRANADLPFEAEPSGFFVVHASQAARKSGGGR